MPPYPYKLKPLESYQRFHELLIDLAQNAKLSRPARLADAIGANRTTVQRWRDGKSYPGTKPNSNPPVQYDEELIDLFGFRNDHELMTCWRKLLEAERRRPRAEVETDEATDDDTGNEQGPPEGSAGPDEELPLPGQREDHPGEKDTELSDPPAPALSPEEGPVGFDLGKPKRAAIKPAAIWKLSCEFFGAVPGLVTTAGAVGVVALWLGWPSPPKPPEPPPVPPAQLHPPASVADCEMAARPPFDPTLPDGTPGLELVRMTVGDAKGACKLALEYMWQHGTKEGVTRIKFLQARVLLAEALAGRMEARRQILNVLNDLDLYGTKDPVSSEAARQKLSEVRQSEAGFATKMDEQIESISIIAMNGYIPAVIEELLSRWRFQAWVLEEKDVRRERMLSLVENFYNSSSSSVRNNPVLQEIRCGIMLQPYFVSNQNVRADADLNRIASGIDACKQAQASGVVARTLLALANYYELPGTPNGELVGSPKRVKQVDRARELKKDSSFSGAEHYGWIYQNIAWVLRSFPTSIHDIYASIRWYEASFIRSNFDSDIGSLCGMYGIDWAEGITDIPEEWKSFQIDVDAFYRADYRPRRMVAFCRWAEGQSADWGMYVLARARVSGEAEAFGIERDLRKAADLFTRYAHDPRAGNRNARRIQGVNKLSDVCELLSQPEKYLNDRRYRQTAQDIIGNRNDGKFRADLDYVCRQAAEGGDPYSAQWLFLISTGLFDGISASRAPETTMVNRLIQLRAEAKANSNVRRDRLIGEMLAKICENYKSDRNFDQTLRIKWRFNAEDIDKIGQAYLAACKAAGV